MNKISIIIPVYNSEKFLDACVCSVINQTYNNLEIILVDDGSTDNSGALCDKWKVTDSRIKVIHQKNQGVSAARNHGLETATGDFISFIDSDDVVEPEMYELLMGIVVNRGADIAHCGYKRLDEQGNVLKEVSGTHVTIEQSAAEAVKCMLEGVYFVGGLWNKLYSYKTVKGLRFCEELKNNEDILFNVLAFQNAESIIFVDETKYCYYERSSSACNQMKQERQLRDSAFAADIMLEQCKDYAILNVVQNWNFETKCNLYRFLLMDGQSETVEAELLRCWLHNNRFVLKRKRAKRKINFYSLFYFPSLYRFLYKIYDKVRKPNWDVR